MTGITSVETTGLFWETLEEDGRRNHRRYRDIRASIEELAIRKSISLNPVGKRDAKFGSSNKHLNGIWHCTLCWEPDTVLFYTVCDRVLSLAMIGSHQDYPHARGNFAVAERTASRIWSAVESGNVATPNWRTIPWRRPSDLVHHPEIHEASPKVLMDISDILRDEAADASIFTHMHGKDVTDADIRTFDEWFNEVEQAQSAIYAALAARPVTGEEKLARLVEEGSLWARAI